MRNAPRTAPSPPHASPAAPAASSAHGKTHRGHGEKSRHPTRPGLGCPPVASGVCPARRALGWRRGCKGGGVQSIPGAVRAGGAVPHCCRLLPRSPPGARSPPAPRGLPVAPQRPRGQRGQDGGTQQRRAGPSPLPRQRRSPSPGAPRRQPERGSSQPVNAGARNICFPRAPSDERSRHKAGIQASAARLGARPDHGPSATSGETEARRDGAHQHRGATPPKSQSWHRASLLSVTVPAGSRDPPPAPSSLVHPCPSRCLCETQGCTSTGDPPAGSPALLSPGRRRKAASRQPGKAEMLKYTVQGGGMIPLPNFPPISPVHPSVVQGASWRQHPSPLPLPLASTAKSPPQPWASESGLRALCPLRARLHRSIEREISTVEPGL